MRYLYILMIYLNSNSNFIIRFLLLLLSCATTLEMCFLKGCQSAFLYKMHTVRDFYFYEILYQLHSHGCAICMKSFEQSQFHASDKLKTVSKKNLELLEWFSIPLAIITIRYRPEYHFTSIYMKIQFFLFILFDAFGGWFRQIVILYSKG